MAQTPEAVNRNFDVFTMEIIPLAAMVRGFSGPQIFCYKHKLNLIQALGKEKQCAAIGLETPFVVIRIAIENALFYAGRKSTCCL